jgi:hypothetical protein
MGALAGTDLSLGTRRCDPFSGRSRRLRPSAGRSMRAAAAPATQGGERRSDESAQVVVGNCRCSGSWKRAASAIWHAALWGLGRVVAAEHPEIWGCNRYRDDYAGTCRRGGMARGARRSAGGSGGLPREYRFVARLERRYSSGTAHSPRLARGRHVPCDRRPRGASVPRWRVDGVEEQGGSSSWGTVLPPRVR